MTYEQARANVDYLVNSAICTSVEYPKGMTWEQLTTKILESLLTPAQLGAWKDGGELVVTDPDPSVSVGTERIYFRRMMTEKEVVREKIAAQFRIARQEGVLRRWADGTADADEILALKRENGEPRLGIIADDQSLPTGVFDYEQHKRIFRESGFRKVVTQQKEG